MIFAYPHISKYTLIIFYSVNIFYEDPLLQATEGTHFPKLVPWRLFFIYKVQVNEEVLVRLVFVVIHQLHSDFLFHLPFSKPEFLLA